MARKPWKLIDPRVRPRANKREARISLPRDLGALLSVCIMGSDQAKCVPCCGEGAPAAADDPQVAPQASSWRPRGGRNSAAHGRRHRVPNLFKDGSMENNGTVLRPNTMQEMDYNLLTEVVANTLDVCRKHYGSVPAIPELIRLSQQALENLGVKGDLREREADFTKIVDMLLHGQGGTCAPPARRSSKAGTRAPQNEAQDAQYAPCPPPPPCPPPARSHAPRWGWWARLLPRRIDLRPTIEHDLDFHTQQQV